MYICMYVCMFNIWRYACTFVWMYVFTYVCIYVCMYECMYVCKTNLTTWLPTDVFDRLVVQYTFDHEQPVVHWVSSSNKMMSMCDGVCLSCCPGLEWFFHNLNRFLVSKITFEITLTLFFEFYLQKRSYKTIQVYLDFHIKGFQC